ncbi:PREDICTED: histone-lysine N-methyltransferase 2D-like, partial [Chaetura pelagica]
MSQSELEKQRQRQRLRELLIRQQIQRNSLRQEKESAAAAATSSPATWAPEATSQAFGLAPYPPAQFDLLAYTDPELDTGDKKDIFNEHLRLVESANEKAEREAQLKTEPPAPGSKLPDSGDSKDTAPPGDSREVPKEGLVAGMGLGAAPCPTGPTLAPDGAFKAQGTEAKVGSLPTEVKPKLEDGCLKTSPCQFTSPGPDRLPGGPVKSEALQSTDKILPHLDKFAAEDIMDPIAKAKMVALKGIKKVMAQGSIGVAPGMNRSNPFFPTTLSPFPPSPFPPGPSPFPPDLILFSPPPYEADQRQYEEWLFHTQQALALKGLEEQIGAHRKSRKALCAKQRTAKKAGREFPEADAEKLKLVTEQQSKIQKQLDQVRKQQKEHTNLMAEYRNKQQQHQHQASAVMALSPSQSPRLMAKLPGQLLSSHGVQQPPGAPGQPGGLRLPQGGVSMGVQQSLSFMGQQGVGSATVPGTSNAFFTGNPALHGLATDSRLLQERQLQRMQLAQKLQQQNMLGQVSLQQQQDPSIARKPVATKPKRVQKGNERVPASRKKLRKDEGLRPGEALMRQLKQARPELEERVLSPVIPIIPRASIPVFPDTKPYEAAEPFGGPPGKGGSAGPGAPWEKGRSSSEVSVMLTVSAAAAKNLNGVMVAMAELLSVKIPSSYEVLFPDGAVRAAVVEAKKVEADVTGVLGGKEKAGKVPDGGSEWLKQFDAVLPGYSLKGELDLLTLLRQESPAPEKTLPHCYVNNVSNLDVRQLSGDEARPRLKKWKGVRWKRLRFLFTIQKGGAKRDGEKEIAEFIDKLGTTLRPEKVPRDLRKCCFCHEEGDGATDGPARLLNLDLDLWVHLNCALWSTEVYETQGGALINVEVALHRGLLTKCSLCQKTGATNSCNRIRCPSVYHFACAIRAKCMFFKDKTMLCPLHKLKGPCEQELSSFTVFRRVYIERDEVKQIASIIQRGERLHMFRVGGLVFHAIGQLLPHQMADFHSVTALYPVGYEATRIYWSLRTNNRRCSCQNYLFRYGRHPLMELPLMINPTGCARAEPKILTHYKRPHTLNSTSMSKAYQSTFTGETNTPYSKQFVHSKSSQYRRLKTEWKNNVYLARSRIQG